MFHDPSLYSAFGADRVFRTRFRLDQVPGGFGALQSVPPLSLSQAVNVLSWTRQGNVSGGSFLTKHSTPFLHYREIHIRDLLLRLRRQIPALRIVGLVLLLPIVVLYAVVALQPYVPFSLLLRDPNASVTALPFGTAFFYGAL